MNQAITRKDRAGNAHVTATWLNKRRKCYMHDCYAYWLEDVLETCNLSFHCHTCMFLHERQEGTMQWYFRVKDKKLGQQGGLEKDYC